jgi:hypothetical protein
VTEVSKLARVSNEELLLILTFRILSSEHQEHLRDLAESMAKRATAHIPSNVVLLADPSRKFRSS